MSQTARHLVDRAWELKNDPNGVRWLEDSCLRALNDGQREIVTYLPSSYALSAKPTLAAGTRQTMAGFGLSDGLQFMDVPRNFAADGLTPGRAIKKVDRDWLDEKRPDWHSDTQVTVVQHYCVDPTRDPKALYVWPPSDGLGKVEVIYSAVPPDMTHMGSLLPLDDIYANALVYFLLFRMSMVNKPGQVNPAAAQGWYSLMLQVLGVKDQRTRTNDQKGGTP